jgi:hypothetical protein
VQAKALRAAGAEKVWPQTASGAKPIALGSAAHWRRLTKRRAYGHEARPSGVITGAGFRSLCDTWADTAMPHERIMLPARPTLIAPDFGAPPPGPVRGASRRH